MAKVCVGCGLTTDTDGNLVAAVSGVHADSDLCKVAQGTLIYCDDASGKLYGPPEKFSFWGRTGKGYQETDVNQRLTSLVAQNNKLLDVSQSAGFPAAKRGPLTFTIKNPSPCLPMNVMLEAGISHARLDYATSSGGNVEFEMSVNVDVTGAVQNFSGQTAHQIWAYGLTNTGGNITFDTMGARAFVQPIGATVFTVAAGGTMTVTLTPYFRLDLNGDSDTADLTNFTIDAAYWAAN